MQGNKEECTQLARRAAQLLEHIKTQTVSTPQLVASERMSDALTQFVAYVRAISNQHRCPDADWRVLFSKISTMQGKLEQQLGRSRVYRFLHQASMASALNQCGAELNDVWHAFDVSSVQLCAIIFYATEMYASLKPY